MFHDILIVGGGSAGLSAAIFSSQLGLDTALIEQSKDGLGGECLRSGCVPSKSLIHIAKTVNDAERLGSIGVRTRGSPQWSKIKDRIQSTQRTIGDNEDDNALQEHGITTYYGEAAFQGERTIQVNETVVGGDTIILATGSHPFKPPIQGLQEAHSYTNETIFTADEQPDDLLVVGGGPLGCELGQAMHRLGSTVTIVERGSRLLKRHVPEASHRVESAFTEEGITYHTDATVNNLGEQAQISAEDGVFTVDYDAVLLATGRRPNTDGLNLHKAGIQTDSQGYPETDEYLQTTNENVYAAGDLTGEYQLSHAAELEATTVITNQILPYASQPDYNDVATVTYTDPQVASFGQSRSELDEAGVRYDTAPLRFDEADRAIIDKDNAWGELYVTSRTLRGGVIVSRDAEHIVQEPILAQHADINTTTLAQKTYPYPSIESVTKHSLLHDLKDRLPGITKSIARFAYRYL